MGKTIHNQVKVGNILFTIIVNYKGGTFISQSNEPNLSKAIRKWSDSDLLEIFSLLQTNQYYRKKIKKRLNNYNDKFYNLDGLQNVWDYSIGIIEKDEYFSITIVKTDSIPDSLPKSAV
ncbi:hypothetical protein ACF3NR_11440 [Vaginella massiliensis]|uniref:hypothetical protein n=1 Tax=Vaginella massiliensis TaxID=1816680 RepID=UPI00375015BD